MIEVKSRKSKEKMKSITDMRHPLLSWIVSIMLSAVTMSSYAQSSGFEKLDTKEKIDPFTLLLVTLPIYALYELSILLIRRNE